MFCSVSSILLYQISIRSMLQYLPLSSRKVDSICLFTVSMILFPLNSVAANTKAKIVTESQTMDSRKPNILFKCGDDACWWNVGANNHKDESSYPQYRPAGQ